MENSDIWKAKDFIKRGLITFKKGDRVYLLRKKGSYPKVLEFDKEYVISSVENDFLTIEIDTYPFNKQCKIHKTYMVNKSILRDIIIDSILN